MVLRLSLGTIFVFRVYFHFLLKVAYRLRISYLIRQ